MTRSKRLGLLAAATMLLAVAACSGSSPSTSGGTDNTAGSQTTDGPESTAPVSTDAPVPVAGGEITVGRRSSLFGWQGDLSLNAAMFQTLNMVYGNLVTLDETGTELAPGLAEKFEFDVAYTSVLKRAIRTLWIALDEMDLLWLPVHRSWRLNERHYGGLQGLNKAETAAKHGDAQVKIWRRSYEIGRAHV